MTQILQSRQGRFALVLFAGVVVLAGALRMHSADPAGVVVGYVLGILAGLGISPLLWATLSDLSDHQDGPSPPAATSFVDAGDGDDDDEW